MQGWHLGYALKINRVKEKGNKSVSRLAYAIKSIKVRTPQRSDEFPHGQGSAWYMSIS